MKNADGSALEGSYYYYGEQRAGYITDGGTLSLRHDEALTVLGLPVGTKWEVSEVREDGWNVKPSSGTVSGGIEADATANALFTNYKGKLKLGDLSVSKTVKGNASDKNKDFNFTVTLSDRSIAGTYGDMEFKDGVASFTLSDGESKTATNLSSGISYTVEEDDYSNEGYSTSKTGDSGKISEGDTVRASFINTKGVDDGGSTDTPGEDRDGEGEGGRLPLTGDMLPLVPLVLMMVLAACATAIAAVRLRKN